MEKKSIIRIMIQSIVMILFGIFLFFYLHHEILGYIIGVSGIIVLIPGLLIKPAAKGLVWLQKKIMKGVSLILTWILLVPFFFICFIPGRIAILLSGKDPLDRKFPGNKKSYWAPYSGTPDIEQCKRQF